MAEKRDIKIKNKNTKKKKKKFDMIDCNINEQRKVRSVCLLGVLLDVGEEN